MIDLSDHDSPYTAIDAKLQSVAEAAPVKPAWYEGLVRLRPQSTEEERLEVYRAVRNSGLLPEEAGFFLVSRQIDEIATRDADQDLQPYEERMEQIEAECRFAEGEIWPEGAAPEGYEKLRQEYHRRVEDFGWQSIGFPHAEGPHVWIEGVFRGHEVSLQVLTYAPEDEEPGMKLDMSGRKRQRPP